MTTVRVTCCPLAPRIADLAANLDMSTRAVASAVDGGARVVVLPELVTSGYMFGSRDEAFSVAITDDHAVFGTWSAIVARTDAVVVAGFCESSQDERGAARLYNSAAVVDASGIRVVYRKTHLWDREKLWFDAGQRMPPVVETSAGRIGVAICYDLEFPEVTRHLAVSGADLVAVPTNWPLVERPLGEHPPEIIIAMAAARINRMVIACCDRTGTERGQQWTDGTTVIGADGWPVMAASTGAIDPGGPVTVDADLGAARMKRTSDFADVLGDRRLDLYGGAVEA